MPRLAERRDDIPLLVAAFEESDYRKNPAENRRQSPEAARLLDLNPKYFSALCKELNVKPE